MTVIITTEPDLDTLDGLRIALQKERLDHAHTLRMLAAKHEDLLASRAAFARWKGKRKAKRDAKRNL